VIYVCLRRRRYVKWMMPHHICILKFCLRLTKLNQIQLYQETCKFCVSNLCLAIVGIIYQSTSYNLHRDSDLSRSWSLVSSSLHRTTFSAAASTSARMFTSFLRHELCYTGGPEAASRFAHGAPSRGAKLFKNLCFFFFSCKG
jgi:hypothetical protein